MKREFEVIAVMMRKGYDLLSLRPVGSDTENGVHDRALQVRAPKGGSTKKGDKFLVTVVPVVEEAVPVSPELDSVVIGDTPEVGIEE